MACPIQVHKRTLTQLQPRSVKLDDQSPSTPWHCPVNTDLTVISHLTSLQSPAPLVLHPKRAAWTVSFLDSSCELTLSLCNYIAEFYRGQDKY